MPIIVTTGGPISSLSTAISSAAPTFGDILTAIADDIDDTTGEYTAQLTSAILSAIRYCERFTYYFNETRDITFPTVDGQEWYDGTDNPAIPTLVHIAMVYTEDSNGERWYVKRAMPDDIELIADNSASRGRPYAWTYFGRRIRLYPIPSPTVYTVRLQVGPYRLDQITDQSQSNAWTTEAFDLIKARAKYIIYKDTIKDAEMASEALNDFNDQQAMLLEETASRNSRGVIIATAF